MTESWLARHFHSLKLQARVKIKRNPSRQQRRIAYKLFPSSPRKISQVSRAAAMATLERSNCCQRSNGQQKRFKAPFEKSPKKIINPINFSKLLKQSA
jgi:hypothetical protein